MTLAVAGGRCPAPRTHQPRRALIALALTVMLLAACGSSAAPSPSAATGAPSVYAALFSRVHSDGSVDRDTALAAFSLAIAPLPDVAVPEGPPPADGERMDGSFAIDWLKPYLPTLTTAQRAAVDKALTPDPKAPVVSPGTSQGGSIRLAAYTGDPAQPYRDALVAAQPIIAAHLGRALHLSWALTMNTTQERSSSTLAYSAVTYLPLAGVVRCDFYVNPSLAASGDAVVMRVTMAHEMFHCFQHDFLDRNGGDVELPPSWITEGQAEWAGEMVAGPSSVGKAWWLTYLAEARPLFQRTYDAVGFYLHLSDVGVDPWTIVDAMLGASDNIGAFKAAGAASDAYLDTWASSLFRNPSYGLPWNANAPWTTTISMRPAPIQVPATGGTAVSSRALVNADLEATSSADIVEIRIPGHARLHTTPPGEETGLSQLWLCTRSGGCACPDGQRYDGPPLEDVSATFQLALTGGLGGIDGSLFGHSRDEFCVPEGSGPNASGNGGHGAGAGGGGGSATCGSGCAGSNGDPHLETVDGHTYDLQATGELVLLRSRDGSVEIQARQQPAPNSHGVSINTAVTARVDGHRVGFYVAPGGLELHVDGTVVTAPADGLAVGTGRVIGHRNGYEVDFPDGTALWALAVSNWGINAQIRASDVLRTTGVGLLGSVLPGGLGVPALPDGTRLARAADSHDQYQKVNGQLASAWRVTATTSLFDEAPGRTPDSWITPGYPPEAQVRTIDQADPGRIADATSACSGVVDPGARTDCVYDVVFTGSTDYVSVYTVTSDLIQKGPAALDEPLPPAPSLAGALPPGFEVIAPSMTAISGSVVAPDGTLYLSISEPNDENEVLAVDTSTGAVTAHLAATGSGGVAFAAGSAWAGELDGAVPCGISRLDRRTLAVQAKMAVPCDLVGSTFASLDSAIWFVDRTTADANGQGGWLRRIDPATNAIGTAPADAVSLPFLNGDLLAGDGVLFYGDGTRGWFRLAAGAATFESIGPANPPVFAGDRGLWDAAPGVATFHPGAGKGSITVPFDGSLVGADATAIYADLGDSVTGTPTLWQYPADGGPPRAIALGTTVRTSAGDSRELGYIDDDPLLIGAGRIVKLWVIPAPTDPTRSAVVMQATTLP